MTRRVRAARAKRTSGSSSATDQLLAAYAASARINAYLVENLDPAAWRAASPIPKGRTIAAIVAHMHNCGLRYLERTAPEAPVPEELERARVTQARAIAALTAKRRAVLLVVGAALRDRTRLVGWPRPAAEYLTYYMVHDAHHRGQIMLQARLLGRPLAKQVMIGMWEWRKRARE